MAIKLIICASLGKYLFAKFEITIQTHKIIIILVNTELYSSQYHEFGRSEHAKTWQNNLI